MKFTVKKLTQKDLPQLVELLSKVLDEAFTHYQKRTRQAYKKLSDIKYYTKVLKRKTSIAIGAFDKKRVIGFISLESKDGGVGLVEWFIVDKSYRGKSIGTALMNRLEKEALNKYYHYIFLYTETQKNLTFYKKRGFEYVGLQKKSWFGENEYMMQKILRDRPFDEMFKKYLDE